MRRSLTSRSSRRSLSHRDRAITFEGCCCKTLIPLAILIALGLIASFQAFLSLKLHNNNVSIIVQTIPTSTPKFPLCQKIPCTCDYNPKIRYWQEPADCLQSALYKSAATIPNGERKYVVYQPDLGGWNNIRMAAEVAVVFAHATGRTLVLAPDSVLYLLSANKNHGKNKMSLDNFYEFKRLTDGLDVITMDEFLKTEAVIPGRLLNTWTQGFDLSTPKSKKELYAFLESSCYVKQWSPGKTFLGFNISLTPNGDLEYGSFQRTDHLNRFTLEGARQLIPYDQAFHSHRAIYFPGHDANRLLTHFYGFLFFADINVHRFYLRFVRDRMLYLDEIFCAASRIIDLIQRDALKINPSLDDPRGFAFDAFHIRRGDFQQKHTRLPAQIILKNSEHLLNKDKFHILYIATDEKNDSFFDPFRKNFTVKLLRDYMAEAEIGDLNQNYLGMLEQIICANAHTFIGTPLSTFTNFITRMRGYYNLTADPGRYDRTFYFMPKFLNTLHEAKSNRLSLPMWTREFVDAFENMNTYSSAIQR